MDGNSVFISGLLPSDRGAEGAMGPNAKGASMSSVSIGMSDTGGLVAGRASVSARGAKGAKSDQNEDPDAP